MAKSNLEEVQYMRKNSKYQRLDITNPNIQYLINEHIYKIEQNLRQNYNLTENEIKRLTVKVLSNMLSKDKISQEIAKLIGN